MRTQHPSLFDQPASNDAEAARRAALGAYFTPRWAAEALIERHFPDLSADDHVLEPTCGNGAFLAAIPAHVPATGVELDPGFAQTARERTGRPVIVGDFRTVPLPLRPTVLVGNPPFESSFIGAMLARSFELLPDEGRVGMLLPTFIVQTASTVSQYAQRWQMQAELLPRNLFPHLSKPLVWILFRKTRADRTMVGFALYHEARDVEQMPASVRDLLREGRARSGSVWYDAIDHVLDALGGEAELSAIYAALAPRRPTGNPHWQAKTRQTLQLRFLRTGPARYARTARAA